MKLVGLSLVAAGVLAGCSSGPGAKSSTTATSEHVEPPPDPCVEADAVIASGKKLADAGHHYRALEAAGYATMLCDQPRAARALDQALTDLEITSAMLSGAQPRFNVGHGDGAAAELALSADGSTALSLSTSGRLVSWNAATGRQLRYIDTGQKRSWTMAATRDLARVATGDNDGNVKVWDLVHGKMIAEWKLKTRSVSALAFDPTGELLAAAGVDYDVVVYEAKSGQELRRGKVEAWIRALRYTHDGKGILVATDEALHRLDAESLTEIWKVVPGGQPLALDLSADGKRVAVGGRTAATTVYDAATGAKLSEHRGHEGRIESVAVSAGGVRVAAAAEDAITVWDGTSSKGRSVAGNSLAIALSPDGAILYVATTQALSRFDAATGKALRGGLGGPVSSIVFNPSGTQLAVTARESIAIWNIEKPISVRSLAQRLTTHAAFDGSGKILATGTVTGKVVLWSTSTGKATHSFDTEIGAVVAVAFSPDGSRLAAAGKKGIEIWNTATWRLERSLAAEVSQFGGMAFGPGGRLAALNGMYNVTVWDAASGAIVDDQKLVSEVPRTIVFRGDGALVIAGSYGFLAIRDVDAKKNIQVLSTRGYAFTKATFARNGEWLLAVQAGFKTQPMVRFWNGKTGQPLRGVEMEGNWVRAIGISPDGTRLVAGRADGTLTLWDVGTGKVLGHALSSADGQWAAISADGEVDGSAGRNGGHTLVHWDADGVIVPGPVRWTRRQRPGHWVAALRSTDREAASVSETMAKTGDPTWVEGERLLDSKRYRIAGQTVRLREKPDPRGKELEVVFAGDRIVQIAEHPTDRGWLKVEYADKKGWVRDVTAKKGMYVTSRLTQARPASATGKPRELPPGTLIAPIRWTGGEMLFELDGVEWQIPTDAATRSKDDVAVGKVFERARHARQLGRNDDIFSIVEKPINTYRSTALGRLLEDEFGSEGAKLSQKYVRHSPAHAVVVYESSSRAEALKQLWLYLARRLPQHVGYPRLTKGDTIDGLATGKWVVVAALPRDPAVARAFAEYLRRANQRPSVLAVQVSDPEQLSFALIERSHAESDTEEGHADDLKVAMWAIESGDRIGWSATLPDGSAGIPYPRPRGKISLAGLLDFDVQMSIASGYCGVDLDKKQSAALERGGLVRIPEAVLACVAGD